MHPVNLNDTLLKAVETLAKGVHRLPVVNDKGDVVNIISQSSIIAFLQKNVSKSVDVFFPKFKRFRSFHFRSFDLQILRIFLLNLLTFF
jgi:hypothetical protein